MLFLKVYLSFKFLLSASGTETCTKLLKFKKKIKLLKCWWAAKNFTFHFKVDARKAKLKYLTYDQSKPNSLIFYSLKRWGCAVQIKIKM